MEKNTLSIKTTHRKEEKQSHVTVHSLFFHVLLQLRPYEIIEMLNIYMYINLNGERIKFKEAARIWSFFSRFLAVLQKVCIYISLKFVPKWNKKANPQIVPRLLCYLEIFSPKLPHTHSHAKHMRKINERI